MTPAAGAGGEWSGLLLFARYAYPPNERGYCGPQDHRALLEYRTSAVVDAGLAELAKSFHGPWPYLQLLAQTTGAGGPFSHRIVEAYWVGNDLLDRVDTTDFGHTVESKFRPRVGTKWSMMAEAVPGGIPHHSYHVFGTYPWVGLLTETHRGEPLEILDQCRIRWGRVTSIEDEHVVVTSRPLEFDGMRLYLGEPRPEVVTATDDGLGHLEPLHPGDWVSMHWGWICDRLSPGQLRALRRFSTRQLELTNQELAHPGPQTVLG